MLDRKSDFWAKCVGQIYMIFSFKIGMMTFEATFSDSYGLKECLTIELKFKFFLLLWEIFVLKFKNLHGKSSFQQVLVTNIQNPKSFSWSSKYASFKITFGHSVKMLASYLSFFFPNTSILSTFFTSSPTNMWGLAKENLIHNLYSNKLIRSWGI